jgi:iron complex outermembrane receptor protein
VSNVQQSNSKQSNSKLRRLSRATFARLPLAAAIHLVLVAPVFADADPADTPPATQTTSMPGDTAAPALATVTVTATKRTENVQDVPISMDVLSTETLREMNVHNFDDYVKLLPSVSYESTSPGFSQIYMRGVSSGGDGNHSGPLPSVGIYLDEQPITTIQGPLDLHIYDIERVEALAGPQGTLYGASSESGTLRLITNKPDTKAFSASVSAEVNSVNGGGTGFVTEGYVNVPLSDNLAIRLVGWDERDAGYIDNVFGTRTFPTSGITIDNANRVKNNYNTVDLQGGRAALKWDINDDWSITPTVMGQRESTQGSFAYDPNVGVFKITHFYPESSDDRWIQAALTVQGKIGNFDLTYAYAHLNRDDETHSDYSDYSFWYDTLLGYGSYFHDNAGNLINPSQYINGSDGYIKDSHELRISSPKENRFRIIGGLFWEDQTHDIHQQYVIDNLGSDLSITGWPNTIWLTQQRREDKDEAVFGEMAYDITDKLTATAGGRYFRADNSLKGFFGFAPGYSSSEGEATCFTPLVPFNGAPCSDLNKDVKESGTLGRANLTYKLDDDKMIYGTWSQGFRPGGINRRGTLPPYQADYLTNWEIGWKTTWDDHRFLWNGAVFQEDWKDFQFAFLGQNGLTEIRNAAQAQIRGLETNINWAATYNLNISAGVAFYHSELTKNYCGTTDDAGNPITNCQVGDPNFPDIAPKGTELPITPKVKGNINARYNFDLGEYQPYVQGTLVYVGERRADLRDLENYILGDLPSYTQVDLAAGFKHGLWSFDLFLKNAFNTRGQLVHFAECAETICGNYLNNTRADVPGYPNGQIYTVDTQPRTIGIRVTRDF